MLVQLFLSKDKAKAFVRQCIQFKKKKTNDKVNKKNECKGELLI